MDIVKTDEGLAWTSDNGCVYRYNFDGHFHCSNGPAIEYKNGSRFWYVRGYCHRENGPAKEFSTGRKEYWLFGERIPKKKFTKKLIRQLKMIRIIET
jgi:hypothetical protein